MSRDRLEHAEEATKGEMLFRGMQPVSFIDYPKHIALVLFTGGCNFYCPYCHNKDLVTNHRALPSIHEADVYAHLKKHETMLDAVVITGGEPTLHPRLRTVIAYIRDMGFKVKLDTNGSAPAFLRHVRVDYIALDVKTSFGKYHLLTAIGGNLIREHVLESIAFLRESGIPHEVRITVAPNIIDEEDVHSLVHVLEGVDKVFLQPFNPKDTLDPAYRSLLPPTREELLKMCTLFANANIHCEVRGFDDDE